jgi:hypothetical protein
MIGSTSFQGQYVNNRLFSGKECRQLLRDATLELNAIAEGLSLKFKKGFFQYFYDPKDELYFEAHVLDIVKKDYIESPVSLVRALALNFFGFWFQGRASVSTLVNFVLTFPLLILAGIGIHRGQKNHLNTGPILLILLAFPLAHLPFLGLARYHVPLLPLLALVAFIPLDARNTSHACPARSP